MNASDLPDYSHYSINEFVLDESFRRWVLQPDEETMSFWHSFMLRHPEQQPVIEEASAILLHLRIRQDDLTDSRQERIWQVLDTAYEQQMQPSGEVKPRWQRWVNPFRRWQLAASLTGLLVLAGGGWAYWHYGQRQEVHTNYGQLLTVTLPDGSQVRLNGNSTLSYPTDWTNARDREVWLEGEAFFTVTKQRTSSGRLKFITHTPNLDISVLGTRFNVNTRRGQTQVVLSEGKIQLSQPNGPATRVMLMKPGELATAQSEATPVAIKPAKPQLYTAWTKQEFAFENTPLRAIAQQLNDGWGLTLVFDDDALAERRFTGNLSSQDVETLLTTLAATFDLQVVRDKDRIYLHRQ
ncbi:FecR domain-containing protein [Spirosoma sp. RP8]|uniref:FecR domain-containing protein n=1 Tax=Spirosoma liriopis TaxID=2937440 RepID=A0ABT0HNW6_9BACT|nr:FecR domain-containing protein [Spirosoma liriopis]MCK8493862.1 FecR domain-containing protein [Spirosoma liriopis]